MNENLAFISKVFVKFLITYGLYKYKQPSNIYNIKFQILNHFIIIRQDPIKPQLCFILRASQLASQFLFLLT